MWNSLAKTIGLSNSACSTMTDVSVTADIHELRVLPLPPHTSTDKGLKVSQRFLSRDDCIKYLHCFCRGEIEGLSQPPGYAVNIRRTYVSNNLVDYCCDRGRMPRQTVAQQSKIRRRESTKIGCPFSLQARRGPDGAYDLYITNQFHNHVSSVDVEVHPSLRHPVDYEITEHLRTIVQQSTSNEAQKAIKDATNCPITKQDIYNLKRKFDKIT
jgi:hypothetical protein